jgi:hypothetical protein
MSASLGSGHIDRLQAIYDGYNEHGYGFHNPKQPMVSQLLSMGHIEAEHSIVDPSNSSKVAVQLTASGLQHIGKAPSPATDQTEPSPPPVASFSAAGTPAEPAATASAPAASDKTRGPRIVPEIARTGLRMQIPTREAGTRAKGTRTETYKFAELVAPDETGFDSFFVKATDKMPNPGKTLTGTVTSANKRFKDRGIKFKLVPVVNDVEHGCKGARVFRIDNLPT